MIHLADHVSDIEGDDEAAERLYRDGIDFVGRHFGDHSVRLLHGLNSLGWLLSRRGDAEAETLFRRALGSACRRPDPAILGSPTRCTSWPRHWRGSGRLAEAEPLAREALDLTVKALGKTHQTRRLVPATAHRGNPRNAAALRRSDRVYESAFEQVAHERRHQRRDATRLRLMLLRRGDTAGAETQLLQSLSSLEQAYNSTTHPNVQETRRALMTLYTETRQPELVERYRVPPGRFIPY